jgi:hypothetical protein
MPTGGLTKDTFDNPIGWDIDGNLITQSTTNIAYDGLDRSAGSVINNVWTNYFFAPDGGLMGISSLLIGRVEKNKSRRSFVALNERPQPPFTSENSAEHPATRVVCGISATKCSVVFSYCGDSRLPNHTTNRCSRTAPANTPITVAGIKRTKTVTHEWRAMPINSRHTMGTPQKREIHAIAAGKKLTFALLEVSYSTPKI